MKKKKVALVCSGGGSLGVALLGIIEELEKKGYKFDFYAGVSAGAIVTSMLASGYNTKEIFKFIDETNLFSLAFDFSPSNFGIIKGEKIYNIFKEVFKEKQFKDLKDPLYIGATNFSNGERAILNKGKLQDAVRASISVPILFDPFLHPNTNEWLVDGGLSQNMPLDIAIDKYKGDKIIALDLNGFDENIDFTQKNLFKNNIKENLGRTFKIFFKNQITHIPKDNRVDYHSLNIPFETTDVFKLKKIYEWGKEYGAGIEV